MGSKLCKGRGVDTDLDEKSGQQRKKSDLGLDDLFPLQSGALPNLDWDNEPAVMFQSQENCRHNYALGRLTRKYEIKDDRLSRKDR